MTEILNLNDNNFDEVIEKTVNILSKGGVVIFPTETSYGLAASIERADGIRRVKEIKMQSETKPISIIVSDKAMAKQYCRINKNIESLIDKFMPGPLTLVVEKKECVPKELGGQGLAFRISGANFARELCKKLGCPITATSANISGKEDIYDIKKIISNFDGKVDLIINSGKLEENYPSTVYDSLNNVLLREGNISKQEILRVLSV